MSRLVKEVHVALLGDLPNEKEGLVNKVKRHDNFIRGWSKLAWIFITLLLSTLIAGIYSIVENSSHGQKQTVQSSNTGK